MARKWKGLFKTVEECCELNIELMKLNTYPHGKHPRRRRSLVLSVEDEMSDVVAAINYMIDKHKLDRSRIEKRIGAKYRKYVKRWGETPQIKKTKKQATKRTSKKRAAGRNPQVDVSSNANTTKTT